MPGTHAELRRRLRRLVAGRRVLWRSGTVVGRRRSSRISWSRAARSRRQNYRRPAALRRRRTTWLPACCQRTTCCTSILSGHPVQLFHRSLRTTACLCTTNTHHWFFVRPETRTDITDVYFSSQKFAVVGPRVWTVYHRDAQHTVRGLHAAYRHREPHGAARPIQPKCVNFATKVASLYYSSNVLFTIVVLDYVWQSRPVAKGGGRRNGRTTPPHGTKRSLFRRLFEY